MSEHPTTASAETPLDADIQYARQVVGELRDNAAADRREAASYRESGHEGRAQRHDIQAADYERAAEAVDRLAKRAATVPSDSDEGSRPANAVLARSDATTQPANNEPTAQQALERALAVWEFAAAPRVVAGRIGEYEPDPLLERFRSLVERGRGSGVDDATRERVLTAIDGAHDDDVLFTAVPGMANLYPLVSGLRPLVVGDLRVLASRGSAGPGNEHPPA